jgi:hypothetical protein
MNHLLNGQQGMVNTAELRGVLEAELSRHYGARRSITRLKRKLSAYGSSFTLEELDVRLDDGAVIKLMFKDLSWQALLADARSVKPVFLYNPQREIATYRTILGPQGISTATCYGAVVDVRAGRYWLFLERIPGLRLNHVGRFTVWQQVSRQLAAMHDRFAGAPTLRACAKAAQLLTYDRDFYWEWLHRARAFVHGAKSGVPRQGRRNFDRLAARYDEVVERLIALPVTFIHGEFYPSNVLVERTKRTLRLCPVDWEMAAVGPGLVDLAALTAGNWTEEKKAAMAWAYYNTLTPGADRLPDSFLAALDLCRLHLAIQMLGWSPNWTPPPEYARNWLDEALRIVGRLGWQFPGTRPEEPILRLPVNARREKMADACRTTAPEQPPLDLDSVPGSNKETRSRRAWRFPRCPTCKP